MDSRTNLVLKFACWACAAAIEEGSERGDWEQVQAAATAIAALVKGAVENDRGTLDKLLAYLRDYEQRRGAGASRG